MKLDDPALAERIRKMRSEGVQAMAIRRELRISRTTFYRVLDRLGMPKRLTSLRKGEAPRPKRVRQAKHQPSVDPNRVAQPAFTARPARPLVANGCRFPMWGDRERPGHPAPFCDAPRLAGRSYCDDHHARCYVPVRPARADA